MINRRNILAALTIICLIFGSANASSLVNMDIKKTSDSGVSVTFYVTGTTGNAMVTRKSNNKYVILMPSISSKSAFTPDISSVKEVITGVDVKNIDDGMSGYTKVTFITTKPINIETKMQKTAPLSNEEKETKAIIAQVKTKPNQENSKKKTKKNEKNKTTVNVQSKENSIQEKKSVSNASKDTTNKVVFQDKKTDKPEVKETEPKKTQNITQKEPIATETNTPEAINNDEGNNKLTSKDIESLEPKAIKKTNTSSKKGWSLLLLPILALYMAIKMIKNSIAKSNALKMSFAENLAEKPYVEENYDDLINNKELNWQERYQKYLKETNGKVNKHEYKFIKSDNTTSEIDKKRIELENTYEKTPDIYKAPVNIPEETIPEVQSEDDAIQKQITEIKLKSFAKPLSLNKTNRNKLRKDLPVFNPIKEGRFVKLQENSINRSRRKFNEANLNVSDLIKTGNKYLEENLKNTDNLQRNNYIISSVEEYFSILDREQKPKNNSEDLSKRVAASLAQVKPSMTLKKPAPTHSNPITRTTNTNEYLNGLIVKSGYNIDENRGFYLVSLDGVSAIIGRIKDEIFVIKKFNENVDKLQVRPDGENVYIVKAGNFKSLVDVDENKMGVLIEL